MVKNNKTAIKGLLVLGGVSTAAASVYTFFHHSAYSYIYACTSKNMQKNYYTDIINKKIDQVF